ncbi:MAG: PRC-barrel domain-containing protein [bacterium]|nr:PRC-barrel domain-containing protein [bacterium]
MTSRIINADNVIGVNVKNTQNENLGEVEAIMLDKETGKVAYVVLSYGGFLGMGDKFFALPWSVLTYDPSDDCFKIPLDQQKLKNSPGFDKDQWPDMSSPTWSKSINTYYGTTI